MFIRQIIYRSTPTRPLTEEEMRALIKESHARNSARAITSFLYYAQSCYLHVLEGDYHAIEQLQASLRQDERHANLVTIMDAAGTQRLFPDRPMGSCRLASDALARLASYLDPQLRSALLPTSCDSQDVIKDLLHEFVAEQSGSSRPGQAKA